MSTKMKSLADLAALKLPGAKPGLVAQAKAALRAEAKAAPAPAKQPVKKAPAKQTPADAAAEEYLFHHAMQGVAPVAGSGRQLAPPPPPPQPSGQEDEGDADARLMRRPCRARWSSSWS